MSFQEALLQALGETSLDENKIEQLRQLSAVVGRPEFVKELKHVYIETTMPLITVLTADEDVIAASEMIQIFHKMKSGCGNIGLKRLQMFCALAEKGLKESSLSDKELRELIVRIRDEFKSTLPLLPEN